MTVETSPWLVAISAGRWQVHGIERARNAGIRVFSLDGNADAPGLAVADRSACVDIRDVGAVVRAVEESGIAPAGVISFVSEAGLAAAAAVRKAYGLAGPDEELTHRLTDKKAQRLAWDAAGLPNPAWRAVSSPAQAKEALMKIGLPVIIKPADSAGSRGVTKLEGLEQFDRAVEEAFSHSRSGCVMVEEFIEGLECTVETFSHDGRVYPLLCTEKVKVPGTKGTVAMELRTPELDAALLQKLEETATGALAALGYRNGPGHTEIIVTKDGRPYLVETAGRGAGFMVFDAMIPRASGYDLAQACAVQAVGGEPPEPELRGTPVVLRFFPSRAGTISGVSGFAEAAALAGVEAAPFVGIGERMEQANTDGDRLGYILAWGNSRAQTLERAAQAEEMITFEVEND